MRVLLIHPPVNDPRSPRLALPSLAAFLRRSGVYTQLLDLDLESLLAILEPDNIERAGRVARKRYSKTKSPNSSQKKDLAEISESLTELINPAMQVLRDRDRFFDSGELSGARDILFSCVELVAAAAKCGIHYRLDLLQYEVDGVDATRFGDLHRVSGNRDANIFADYWEEKVFPKIKAEPWDLIGISIPTKVQVIPGLMLSRQLKKLGFHVTIGGNFFSKFIEKLQCLPEFFKVFADSIVVYEGESAIVELLNQLAGKRQFSRVPNLMFLEGSQVHLTRLHQENIRTLPTPDFDGLPLAKYLTPEIVLPIRLARGCYWNKCKFCDSITLKSIGSKPYQFRLPEVFVDDVIHLRNRFKCEHFLITDEAVPPELLEKVADCFLARGIQGINFAAYARLEPGFTPEVCRKVAKIGLKRFFFGLESGCQATLDHMNKGIKINNVREILQNCYDFGIRYHIFSMIGFPEESEASAFQTAEFFAKNRDLIDHPGNSYDIHLLELLLRTPYFREASRMGLKIHENKLAGEFVVGVGTFWQNTHGLTRERIKELEAQFGQRLYHLYTNFDEWPSLLWPALEEYALLYCAEYADRRFPFRLSLPKDNADELCRLRWNAFTLLNRSDLEVAIKGRRGSIVVDERFYESIFDFEYLSVHQLIQRIAGINRVLKKEEIELLRSNLELLLRSNLLQLQCKSPKKIS